jgi:pimeloyl-ACP methyl ester carboxylesterase
MREQQHLDAHRRSVSVSSGRLSCIDVGAGPVTLFLHGLGTSSFLWRHIIEAFAGQRRCVAIDLPGHGHSPIHETGDLSLGRLADLVEEVCQALDLNNIDLVGNDTGGAIAQVFAAKRPGRLHTLTLTNCEAHDNLPPETLRPMVELAEAGDLAPLASRLAADLDLARAGAYGAAFEHPASVSDSTLSEYIQPVFGTPEAARHFERLLVSLDAADLVRIEPELERLDVPTMVVWGTGDQNFDLRWAYWLRDTIPGVREVIEVDGAKLFFPDERPDDLVPHLRRHWAISDTWEPV